MPFLKKRGIDARRKKAVQESAPKTFCDRCQAETTLLRQGEKAIWVCFKCGTVKPVNQ